MATVTIELKNGKTLHNAEIVGRKGSRELTVSDGNGVRTIKARDIKVVR